MKNEKALKRFFMMMLAEENGIEIDGCIFEDDIILINENQFLWNCVVDGREILDSAWMIGFKPATGRPFLAKVGEYEYEK